MKNVSFYNSEISDETEKLYLHFTLGGSRYAINVKSVVEVMKLPKLDYPQKLPANVIGLINYNNFSTSVLDLRFYLNISVTPYDVSNQVLVVKTDESIFGLVIDKIGDIFALEQAKIEYFQFQDEKKIIDCLYRENSETISILNLEALENILRKGELQSDFDVNSLFPTDDDSKYTFMQRSLALAKKFELEFSEDMFSQDKFICFSLAESSYCMSLEYVKEFLKNVLITPIPCNLDYIEGVITLRGDFVTVVNLKKFLDLPSASESEKEFNNIIVVEIPEYKIAFLVDEIFEIMDISEPLINENKVEYSKYILSEVVVDDKLFSILNMKNILSDERFYIEQ